MEEMDIMNRDASDKMLDLILEQIKCYLEVLKDDENWKDKAIAYMNNLQKILE